MSKDAKAVDPRWVAQVTEEMKAAILAKAVDGKVTCPVLRKFAEDNGINYKVAGTAADMAGVRVHNCDLGCF
jgi:DNA-binding transcriptional regulator YhcF (GntR family)